MSEYSGEDRFTKTYRLVWKWQSRRADFPLRRESVRRFCFSTNLKGRAACTRFVFTNSRRRHFLRHGGQKSQRAELGHHRHINAGSDIIWDYVKQQKSLAENNNKLSNKSFIKIFSVRNFWTALTASLFFHSARRDNVATSRHAHAAKARQASGRKIAETSHHGRVGELSRQSRQWPGFRRSPDQTAPSRTKLRNTIARRLISGEIHPARRWCWQSRFWQKKHWCNLMKWRSQNARSNTNLKWKKVPNWDEAIKEKEI